MVDLEAQLASSNPQVERVVTAWQALPRTKAAPPRRRSRPVFEVRRRLGTAGIDRLVRDYEGGLSLLEAAVKYKIGKASVLKLLREQGVTLRPAGEHIKGRP